MVSSGTSEGNHYEEEPHYLEIGEGDVGPNLDDSVHEPGEPAALDFLGGGVVS